jgi:hypothetical protein
LCESKLSSDGRLAIACSSNAAQVSAQEERRSADHALALVPGQAAGLRAATTAITQGREGESTMLTNAFIGMPEKPTEDELAAALGPAKVIWDRLVADLAHDHGVDLQEWNSYSRKAGWSLRLKQKKRTIVWLSPCQDCFRVMFILGDRAVEVARRSKFPQRVIRILDEAPWYPEGTGVRMNVKGPRDIAVVKKLAVIKLEN